MPEKIIGDDRRAPAEEVLNDGITGWCGALFARQISVRPTLDGRAKKRAPLGMVPRKGRHPGVAREEAAEQTQSRQRAYRTCMRPSLWDGRASRREVRESVTVENVARWQLVVGPAVT